MSGRLKPSNQIYDCCFEGHIKQAKAFVHFPCFFFVKWKTNSHKTIAQSVNNNLQAKNGIIQINQSFGFRTYLVYDPETKHTNHKEMYVELFRSSQRQPQQQKSVGSVRVDLADIVDRNCYGEGQEYGLRFSSVMGATMTFYIRLIGKTKMHTILSSSEIDQYTSFELSLPRIIQEKDNLMRNNQGERQTPPTVFKSNQSQYLAKQQKQKLEQQNKKLRIMLEHNNHAIVNQSQQSQKLKQYQSVIAKQKEELREHNDRYQSMAERLEELQRLQRQNSIIHKQNIELSTQNKYYTSTINNLKQQIGHSQKIRKQLENKLIKYEATCEGEQRMSKMARSDVIEKLQKQEHECERARLELKAKIGEYQRAWESLQADYDESEDKRINLEKLIRQYQGILSKTRETLHTKEQQNNIINEQYGALQRDFINLRQKITRQQIAETRIKEELNRIHCDYQKSEELKVELEDKLGEYDLIIKEAEKGEKARIQLEKQVKQYWDVLTKVQAQNQKTEELNLELMNKLKKYEIDLIEAKQRQNTREQLETKIREYQVSLEKAQFNTKKIQALNIELKNKLIRSEIDRSQAKKQKEEFQEKVKRYQGIVEKLRIDSQKSEQLNNELIKKLNIHEMSQAKKEHKISQQVTNKVKFLQGSLQKSQILNVELMDKIKSYEMFLHQAKQDKKAKSQLQSKVKEYHKVLEKMQAGYQKSEKLNTELINKIFQYQAAENDCLKYQNLESQYKRKINNYETTLEQLRVDYSECQQQKLTLQDRIKKYEEIINRLKEEQSSKVELKNRVCEYQRNLETLQQAYNESQRVKKNLQEKLVQYKEAQTISLKKQVQISQLEERIKSYESALQKLEGDSSALQDHSALQDNQVKHKCQQCQNRQKTNKQLIDELKQYEVVITEHKKMHEHFLLQINQYQSTLLHLQGDYNNMQEDKTQLQNKVKEYEILVVSYAENEAIQRQRSQQHSNMGLQRKQLEDQRGLLKNENQGLIEKIKKLQCQQQYHQVLRSRQQQPTPSSQTSPNSEPLLFSQQRPLQEPQRQQTQQKHKPKKLKERMLSLGIPPSLKQEIAKCKAQKKVTNNKDKDQYFPARQELQKKIQILNKEKEMISKEKQMINKEKQLITEQKEMIKQQKEKLRKSNEEIKEEKEKLKRSSEEMENLILNDQSFGKANDEQQKRVIQLEEQILRLRDQLKIEKKVKGQKLREIIALKQQVLQLQASLQPVTPTLQPTQSNNLQPTASILIQNPNQRLNNLETIQQSMKETEQANHSSQQQKKELPIKISISTIELQSIKKFKNDIKNAENPYRQFQNAVAHVAHLEEELLKGNSLTSEHMTRSTRLESELHQKNGEMTKSLSYSKKNQIAIKEKKFIIDHLNKQLEHEEKKTEEMINKINKFIEREKQLKQNISILETQSQKIYGIVMEQEGILDNQAKELSQQQQEMEGMKQKNYQLLQKVMKIEGQKQDLKRQVQEFKKKQSEQQSNMNMQIVKSVALRNEKIQELEESLISVKKQLAQKIASYNTLQHQERNIAETVIQIQKERGELKKTNRQLVGTVNLLESRIQSLSKQTATFQESKRVWQETQQLKIIQDENQSLKYQNRELKDQVDELQKKYKKEKKIKKQWEAKANQIGLRLSESLEMKKKLTEEQSQKLSSPPPQPEKPLSSPSPQPEKPLSSPSPQPEKPLSSPPPQPEKPLSSPSPQPEKPLSSPSPQPEKPLSSPPPQPEKPLSSPSPQPEKPESQTLINSLQQFKDIIWIHSSHNIESEIIEMFNNNNKMLQQIMGNIITHRDSLHENSNNLMSEYYKAKTNLLERTKMNADQKVELLDSIKSCEQSIKSLLIASNTLKSCIGFQKTNETAEA